MIAGYAGLIAPPGWMGSGMAVDPGSLAEVEGAWWQ